MENYTLEIDRPKLHLKARLALLLLYSGLFFILDFSWTAFSQTQRRRGLWEVALQVAVVALVWGSLMVFLAPSRRPKYKLMIDDASITAVSEYTGWMKWLAFRRTVRKGKIRTIFEVKGIFGNPEGIGISEKSRFGARMFGFVFVPRNVEGYSQVRRIAESWKDADSQ